MSTVTKASVYSRTAEDTPDTPSLASIDRFLDAVWMERGLSPNTLSAYRADLTALDRWLQGRGSSSLEAKRADLLAFIAYRVEAGARPRSTARPTTPNAAHCATKSGNRLTMSMRMVDAVMCDS